MDGFVACKDLLASEKLFFSAYPLMGMHVTVRKQQNWQKPSWYVGSYTLVLAKLAFSG